MSPIKPVSFAFFGTGPLAESVLACLYASGYIPSLIVTKPDSPQGRHMTMTEPYIKTWAKIKGIEVYQPTTLKEEKEGSPLLAQHYDIFIVASYGKIIPKNILNHPKKGVLNIHPSLLPKYRGPSPIESALLNGDNQTGVSVMLLDEEVDHGPLLSQNAFTIENEHTTGVLEVIAGQMGGEMLTQVLPYYLDGSLIPKEQDHSGAIFCKKISKELGLITLDDDIREVRRKYRALTPWPGLYFFITHNEKDIRVKVNAIDLITDKDSLCVYDYILSVTPEGKKEMDFESFKRGYLK